MVNLRLFLSFQLKLQYFKSSDSALSENNHTQAENIVLMYSKVFFNSKLKSVVFDSLLIVALIVGSLFVPCFVVHCFLSYAIIMMVKSGLASVLCLPS